MIKARTIKTRSRASLSFGSLMRRVLWSVASLLVVLLLLAAGGLLWVHHAMVASLPVIDGTLRISGLAAPVTIRRDSHGVPHIQAGSQDDLLLAQGYVTAQDRLWQMDGLRRNACGELAEIFGSSMIDHDRAQRVYQFRNVAQRIYNSLPETDRHRYEQYARGVNVFIEQNHLPAEFKVLHYHPRRWSGVDSVLIGLNMVDTLDTHWDTKLSREEIASRLHDPKLEADLYPVGSWRDKPPSAAVSDMTQPHPAPPPPEDDDENDQSQTKLTLPKAADSESANPTDVSEDLARLRNLRGRTDCADCASGSNNWVISGKHTVSGKPLLSNDMHLNLGVPNIWYMADLAAPGLHVAGVTLPGVPFVIAGHNEHVAWGFTALYADVQDLYVEHLDGKGNYAGPRGEWLPIAHSRETIHVRFGADVNVDLELTDHGPLLNPLLPREKRAIALHWTLYDPALASIPLYEINTAGNWQQFSSALGAWCWPTQNVVYADDQGHIAYHAIGKVPMRPGGLVGVPVDDARHEWQGYIPFEEMPSSYDPPSGLLATANSRVTPSDTHYPLTLEWIDPYRAERIYSGLRGRDKLTRNDMLSVQTDIYSAMDQELAHRFAYAIDRTLLDSANHDSANHDSANHDSANHAASSSHDDSADKRLRQAADLLRSWDGRMSVDSPAASIVYRARQAFMPLILEPRLGTEATAYSWGESNFAEEEIIMHGAGPKNSDGSPNSPAPQPNWLPAAYKDWDALLTAAVLKGLEQGQAPQDLSRWTYGSWHVVDLEHPLFQLMPVVKSWTGTGAQPLSGDSTTVKAAGRAFGPSQRFTMDWSDPDASTENIVLGESGNPVSAWFKDQWPSWYGGSTFAMPFSAQAVAGQTAHTLELKPQ